MSAVLFQEVVRASGVTPLLAPGTIRRALADAGIPDPQQASIGDYRRALPKLEARLRAYLPPHEVTASLSRIRALLSRGGEP